MSKPTAAPAEAEVVTPAPVVTPAGTFRRGGLYQLPHCGHTARLRWPGLYALAMRGDVPNALSEHVLRLVSGAAGESASEELPAEELATRRMEAYRKNARGYVEVSALCFDEPRMVLDRAPDYERGEIGPGDIPEQDHLWIFFEFVQGGPASDAVAPFRVG